MEKLIRTLALEVLDDPHGISQDAWEALYRVLDQCDTDLAAEFAQAVDGSEGRVFLPEGHGIK